MADKKVNEQKKCLKLNNLLRIIESRETEIETIRKEILEGKTEGVIFPNGDITVFTDSISSVTYHANGGTTYSW